MLRVSVDNTTPLGYGFERQVDVFFDNSPVFRLGSGAASQRRRVAWFASASPLRSGWAWGQQYLENGVAVADAKTGSGSRPDLRTRDQLPRAVARDVQVPFQRDLLCDSRVDDSRRALGPFPRAASFRDGDRLRRNYTTSPFGREPAGVNDGKSGC